MDSKTEIAILKCVAKNAEDLSSVWQNIANGEANENTRLKSNIWNIMGRGVIRENEFGDATEVALDINDWRELCEAVNFGV